jgi:hypothetical protein
MKKIVLTVLLAVGLVFGVYAQAAATPASSATPAASGATASSSGASLPGLSDFQSAAQSAQSYSDNAHKKLDNSADSDYAHMNNARIYKNYQNRLSAQQAIVDQKQAYLDSLIKQQAPTTNINMAQKSAQAALSQYDTSLRDFTAWVASVASTEKQSGSTAASPAQ